MNKTSEQVNDHDLYHGSWLGTCGVCLEVRRSNHVLAEVLESMIVNGVHLYMMWNGAQETVTLIESEHNKVTGDDVHSLGEP